MGYIVSRWFHRNGQEDAKPLVELKEILDLHLSFVFLNRVECSQYFVFNVSSRSNFTKNFLGFFRVEKNLFFFKKPCPSGEFVFL